MDGATTPIDPERLHIETDLIAARMMVEELKPKIGFLDKQIPQISSIQNWVNTALVDIELTLKRLDRSVTARRKIAELVEIDPRLKMSPMLTHTTSSAFVPLNKDESYDDFKFVIGKIVKRGWRILKAQEADGTVDYTLSHDEAGAYVTIYVEPGDSEKCRIEEREELRQVKVKRIVCGGVVKGEMAGATLSNPLPIKPGDLDLPF